MGLSSTSHGIAKMGRVRTKTVKKSAKVIIERYYPKLTLDFETNKRICDEIAIIPSKRLRNKIAGYTTHLMKRIQRGPVRGISFKLQEEERERKDQYVPEISALDFSQNENGGQLEVDSETKDLLKSLGFDSIPSCTRIGFDYDTRSGSKQKSHDLKDGILVRVSGLGCFLGVFAGCSAGWMDGLRILDQCEIFPT